MSDGEARVRALKLWEADRARLMFQQPFLGMLAMQLELKVVVDEALPTAATDGQSIFGNAHFLCRATDEERLFILAHEIWHCAALHHQRRQGREPTRWNYATDYEVNALLAESGLTVPEGALYERHFRGRSAEYIYNALPRRLDSHRGEYSDPHPWDSTSSQGGGAGDQYRPRPSEAAWRQWPRRVVAAWQQAGRSAELGRGRLPAGMEILLGPLLNPQLPWSELLRRYLAPRLDPGRRSWSRPNRRYVSRGLHLPGPVREHIDLAVAIDTSGSTRSVLPKFFAELRGIAGSYPNTRIRLLQADAAIQEDCYISAHELTHGRIMRGGGGTDFCPVFERLEQEPPDLLIYLTDGMGTAPETAPEYDVVWLLCGHGNTDLLSWGDRIAIPDGLTNRALR